MLVESSAASEVSALVVTARVARGVVVAVLVGVALYFLVYGGFASETL